MVEKIWADMFHPDISLAEKMIRPVLVYFFLIIACESRENGSWRSSIPSIWSCC